MNQLPWAVCSRAEGSTMHSVSAHGMNNEPFPETFPISVSAFSFLLNSLIHSPVTMGRYKVCTEQTKAPTLDLFIQPKCIEPLRNWGLC